MLNADSSNNNNNNNNNNNIIKIIPFLSNNEIQYCKSISNCKVKTIIQILQSVNLYMQNAMTRVIV